MADDWQMVRDALIEQGVVGGEDLGRFVSNTEFLRPSALDDRVAMPVFLSVLPRVSNPKVVCAIAGHLRRPWARPAVFAQLYCKERGLGCHANRGCRPHQREPELGYAASRQFT